MRPIRSRSSSPVLDASSENPTAPQRAQQSTGSPRRRASSLKRPSITPFQGVCLAAGPLGFALLALFYRPEGLTTNGVIVLGIALWMATWWISECIPLPATALLPILILPSTGVLDSGETFSQYSNNIIFLFMGGFLLAGALEKWGVHKRIALHIVRALGISVPRLILGFMLATSVLSFFVTNTAATMMMLPMGLAVISSLRDVSGKSDQEDLHKFEKSLIFGIGYSATIFGMSTVLGGTSIPFFIAHTKETLGIEISFAQFVAFGVPVALVFLLLFWVYLVKVRFRMKIRELPGGKEIISKYQSELGRVAKEEVAVICVVVFVSCLWITRTWLISPFVPEITDGMIAVLGAILMFLLPARGEESKRILEWEDTKKVPWGVLLLLGGGFALAGAVDSSGLSTWVGDQFAGLGGLHFAIFILVTVLALAFLTEFTSTGATAILFVPLMGTVAQTLGYDPLLVMLAATLAVNCAFMLPAATPPNSVIYGTGLISIKDMVTTGFAVTLLGSVIIAVSIFTWAPLVF